MATELRLAVNKLSGSVRHETFAGRDYLIAPVVAIVAGVLNGELVPADEISKFTEMWAGIPVPLGHPRENGQFVSANSPEIVAKTPARFFHPDFPRTNYVEKSGSIWRKRQSWAGMLNWRFRSWKRVKASKFRRPIGASWMESLAAWPVSHFTGLRVICGRIISRCCCTR